MADILILHGPNLNMLGIRQPELYGHETLKQLNTQLEEVAKLNHVTLDIFQHNAEHELIDKIHQAYLNTKLVIINPAGFTHTSVALKDALLSIALPYIEVHLSNIYARESYRQSSLFSDKAIGVISGFGTQSYTLALLAACRHLITCTE
jgi:3-dehydroquinate dehydratase-2